MAELTETTRAKALVIESDRRRFDRLSRLFDRAKIECVVARREEGVIAFRKVRPDLVLLDVAPPIAEARHILEAIRETPKVPVIAVSSRKEDGAAAALRMGADDFLHADFSEEETIARVEVLMRRNSTNGAEGTVLADGVIELDFDRHRVSVEGTEVPLTPTEFRLLAVFLRHPGQALTHSQILEMVWEHGYRATDEVKLYVSYLRRKLRAEADVDPIETLRGIGYRYRPSKSV